MEPKKPPREMTSEDIKAEKDKEPKGTTKTKNRVDTAPVHPTPKQPEPKILPEVPPIADHKELKTIPPEPKK